MTRNRMLAAAMLIGLAGAPAAEAKPTEPPARIEVSPPPYDATQAVVPHRLSFWPSINWGPPDTDDVDWLQP
ncbi:MAG: hypothetical protein L6R19_05405 [Alphaproteobacteria bacterium]|nr:hypothetical protein [Alphaproteobacteria bacterium]